MAGRIVLLVVAVAAIVLATSRLHSYNACMHAGSILLGQSLNATHVLKTPVRGDPAQAATEMLDHCDDADFIAEGSVALIAAGNVTQADRMARAAIRRAPHDERSWEALAYVLTRERRYAERARARQRIHELDPLRQLPPGT
jgi:Flp pilus assembly protein TadD